MSKEALKLTQPAQEPVAYFHWLPEGATHIAQIKVNTKSGGRLEMGTYVFKYDNEVLMVYTTDNDNEYPRWREAKECFYHLNFSVFPIPTTPPQPAQEPVAWMNPSWIDPDTRGWQSDSFESIPIEGWLPIYTSPPQPAHEPAFVTYKEVADIMNRLWRGTPEQKQIAIEMENMRLYTTPPQRPWVGLTDKDRMQILDATEGDERGFVMKLVEDRLKEKNT
jgi:hypothetical protein